MAKESGVVKEQYRYDAHGRRVNSEGPSLAAIRSFYNQGGQLAFQQDLRQAKNLAHVYLAGSLVTTREQPTAGGAALLKFHHTDALGSPIAVTGIARSEIELRSEYEPYGEVINRPLNDRPGYTGHVEDKQTGLTYMQQRYFDPICGCFLSVDPVTAFENPFDMFNRYWYANNNPYGFTDPDGRCTAASSATTDTPATSICQDAKTLNLSGNGAKNITGFEGYKTQAYAVGSDKPTIGIGHTDGVSLGDSMSKDQVAAAFASDVSIAERAVENLVGKLPVSQQEFDALVDLAFNVGGGKLNSQNSPGLNRAIAQGDYAAIGDNLRYTRGPDGLLPGLVQRSNSRQSIFSNGNYEQGLKRYSEVMKHVGGE